MTANQEIIAELRRVLNERDEARAALAACPDCAMYAERSARFAEQADQLQRERDEANARRDDLRTALEWSNEERDRLQRERDEARAEVERLRAEVHARTQRITEVGVMVATNGNALAKDAYRRGAEAMREAAMGAAWHSSAMALHKKIKDLPIPEEP